MVEILLFILIVFLITIINFGIYAILSSIIMCIFDSQKFGNEDNYSLKCMILGGAVLTFINNLVMTFIFMPYMGIVTPFSRLMLAVFD